MGNEGTFAFPSYNSSNSYLELFRKKLTENYLFSQASLPYIQDKKTGRKYATYQYTTNFSRQAQLLEQSLQKIKLFPNPNVTQIKDFFRQQQNSYCTQKDMFLIVYCNPQPYRLQKQFQIRKINNRKFQTQEILKILQTILSGLWFYERQLPLATSQQDIFSSRFIELDMNSVAIDKNPQYSYNLNRIYLLDPWLEDIISPKHHKNIYQAPQKAYIKKQDKMSTYNRFLANLYIVGIIGLELFFMKSIQSSQNGNSERFNKVSIDRYLNSIIQYNKSKQNMKLRQGLSILLQTNPNKRQEIYKAWQFSTVDIRYLYQQKHFLQINNNQQIFRNRSFSQPFSYQKLPHRDPQFIYKPQQNYIINRIDNYNSLKNHSQLTHQSPAKINFPQKISNRQPLFSHKKSQSQQQNQFKYFKRQQQKNFQQPTFQKINKSYTPYKNNTQYPKVQQNLKHSNVKFNKLPQLSLNANLHLLNDRSLQQSYFQIPNSVPNNYKIFYNNNQPSKRQLNRVNSVSHYSNIPQNKILNSFPIAQQKKFNHSFINQNQSNLGYSKSFETTLNELKKLQNDINALSSKIKNELVSSSINSNIYQQIKTETVLPKKVQQTSSSNNAFNFLKYKQESNQYKKQAIPYQSRSNQDILNIVNNSLQKPPTEIQQKQLKSQPIQNLPTNSQQQYSNPISSKQFPSKQIVQTQQSNKFNFPIQQKLSQPKKQIKQQQIQSSIISEIQIIQQKMSPQIGSFNLSNKRQEKTTIKPINDIIKLEKQLKFTEKLSSSQQQNERLRKLEQLWKQNKQISNDKTIKAKEQEKVQIDFQRFMKNQENRRKGFIIGQKSSQQQHQGIILQYQIQSKEKINNSQGEFKNLSISDKKNQEKNKKIQEDESTKINIHYQPNKKIQQQQGIIFQALSQNSSGSSKKHTEQKKKQEHSHSNEQEYVCQEYQSGSKYEGFKKNGMRNGKGKFSYLDGGYYEGDWLENKMHGWGKLFYESGKIAYEGYWSNDQFHGFGKVYNDSPVPLDTPFDYRNFDKLQDYWAYYEGSLVEDTKQGKGRIMLTNGQKFEGDFHADRIQGYGKYWKMDGTTIQGIWKDSQLIKLLSK